MKQWDSYAFLCCGMGILAVGSLDESDPIFCTQIPAGKETNEMRRIVSLIILLLLIAVLVVAAIYGNG